VFVGGFACGLSGDGAVKDDGCVCVVVDGGVVAVEDTGALELSGGACGGAVACEVGFVGGFVGGFAGGLSVDGAVEDDGCVCVVVDKVAVGVVAVEDTVCGCAVVDDVAGDVVAVVVVEDTAGDAVKEDRGWG
jgi:hypothetical protein